MKMLADYILIRPEGWPTAKIGSILVPPGQQDKFARGEVIAVGPGRFTINGVQLEPTPKPGQHVLYYKQQATEVTVDEAVMHVVCEPQIISILVEGDFGQIGETTDGSN